MAYRNKIYTCFDGDTDMKHYRLMTAWAENENIDFEFYNAHDLNTARDTSQEESIKRQLRERLANSKAMVVLIGEKTKLLTKFVKWEMEIALKKDLPIIGVNLNGSRNQDDRCPPIIKNELVMFVPFGVKIVSYALTNWPARHAVLRKEGTTGARVYNEKVYKKLGL